MYLRISTQRKNGKTYRYAQLVESYRRDDGTPTNRVIATLGRRSEEEIAAIRAALEIARSGKTAVVPREAMPKVEVLLSLRYLDVAVLLRAWHDFGLHGLLQKALGASSSECNPVEVIAALVLQRCLAPGSKLAASRWYPNTALAELQGIEPAKFNNSRVHRALTALEAGEDSLQSALPAHLANSQKAATAVFLDATDTWFVGQGPPMALKGRDKQGVFRRRVGIVLLCDQEGLPLRWKTLDGNFHDPTSLYNMASEAADFSWANQVPLVVDRALGAAGWVEKLALLGLHYVTCVPVSEFESCGAPIPWQLFDDLQNCDDDVQCVQEKAVAAGFQRVNENRYVLELGAFEKNPPKTSKRPSMARFALGIVNEIEKSSQPDHAVAKRLNLTRRTFYHYKKLTSLNSQVRHRIDNRQADGLSLTKLKKIASLPTESQLAELDSSIQSSKSKYVQVRKTLCPVPPKQTARAAIAINPKRFIEDRQADINRLVVIRERVDKVNGQLASPRSKRKDSSALAEIDKIIRRYSLGHVCSTSIEKRHDSRRVVLHFDEKAWRRRYRSYGVSLIVSHPDVKGSAAERVSRYFSKNEIERDFQSIKSVFGLRPVHHHTDRKLRAHVTLCVLALLLSRLIEQRLKEAGKKHSLSDLAERLEPVRLDLLKHSKNKYYAATHPTEDIEKILSCLNMEELCDNVAISKVITPR